jgi:hypothetical protein
MEIGMSEKRKPWMKFYPADWQADEGLKQCSLASRGLWIEMIAVMHKSVVYGHLLIAGFNPTDAQIAMQVGSDAKTVRACIAELESWGVFSRTDVGVIYSRRMIDDQAREQKNVDDGHGGGNPDIRRGTVPKQDRARRFRPSDNLAKTERIMAKSNGLCHWCSVPLQRVQAGPDYCHIDHVVAICDGGGNEDSNLVAACADCNHRRARISTSDPNGAPIKRVSDPNPVAQSDPNLQTLSDPKAQRLEARDKKESKPFATLTRPNSQAQTGFDEFWKSYPRREAKRKAEQAFAAALKRGASVGEIIRAVSKHRWSPDPQFIPLPATWLNASRWLDEQSPASSVQPGPESISDRWRRAMADPEPTEMRDIHRPTIAQERPH